MIFKVGWLLIIIPIVIVLATGICGCITSTSTTRVSAEDYTSTDILAESPFGFHTALVAGSGYNYAQDIHVVWDRPSLYVFWFKVQPDLTQKEYNWTDYDRQFGRLPEGMYIMANIATVPTSLVVDQSPLSLAPLTDEQLAQERELARKYVQEGSYLPSDIESYLAFVRACVERYDGDGIDDMPGLTRPIKYWQVDNEPPRGLQDYAEFLKITYQAIKTADPDAKVLIGGATGMPPILSYLQNFNTSFLPILDELAQFEGQYFDIFDIHWYGDATGDYRGLGEVYNYIASKLDALGLSPLDGYWVTEMGTYSGDPPGNQQAFQTERQQARDIIKRYVYSLSLGIKKIFLAFGLIEGFHQSDNYFNHTGIIYDGRDNNDLGLGIKKLAYYSYKKMTEVLEECDWSNTQTIQEKDGVYIYKFTRQGKPVWVAWNDTGTATTITLPLPDNINNVKITEAVPKYESGKEVTDYSLAFTILQYQLLESNPVQLQFELGETPVFIEEAN